VIGVLGGHGDGSGLVVWWISKWGAVKRYMRVVIWLIYLCLAFVKGTYRVHL
jgi:hypothetical protein